ncbi:MAG: BMP family ABC transporter substrate-binding protein [Propionibacteriaceae bacterium]|jgi:basic membrane protein A|nr:BMP family ABC transporter substrate-binding protein [Propionibacteriaceae bacterium]
MTLKKTLTTVAAGLAAGVLALSGCAAAPEDKPGDNGTTGSGNDFLGCMISDQGGFDDKSFNQSGWDGLARAQSELGVKTQRAESKNSNDFANNIRSMQTQNCDLIVTVGFMLKEATETAAREAPDDRFAIVDDAQIALDNVKPLVFKTSDASFLAGYLAAGYSKTGVVATFGGGKIPSVSIFMDGFVDGVARYNEDSGKSVQVLGWDKEKQDGSFTGDFEDQSKGKNTTKNFIDQGADVIMPVAGPVGLGAAAAAREASDVAIIWVDTDGYVSANQYQDLFLTSVVKEIAQSIFDTVKETVDGQFTSQPYVGTLANGGVGIAPYHDFDSKVPAELKAKVEELKADIVSGALKVTSPSDPQ